MRLVPTGNWLILVQTLSAKSTLSSLKYATQNRYSREMEVNGNVVLRKWPRGVGNDTRTTSFGLL